MTIRAAGQRGGETTRDRHGPSFYEAIVRKGGETTKSRHGRRHFETIGKKGKVETVPAGPKYSRILAATDGRIHVSGGWAVTQMLDGLERGVHAFTPEGSMVAIYRTIMARYLAGDRESARDLFERLLPVLAFANQHIDVSVQFFKRVLVAKGVFRTSVVREPILRFDDVQERFAAGLVARVLELEQSLA